MFACVRQITKSRVLSQSINSGRRSTHLPQILPSPSKNRNKANLIEANDDQEPFLITAEEDIMPPVNADEHVQQSQEEVAGQSYYINNKRKR